RRCMARGRTGSEEYWKDVIEDYLASKRGLVDYCQKHKVSKSSLYKWSHQLGIPLKQGRQESQTQQINIMDKEEPRSFIELDVPKYQENATIPLKLDLLITPERQVKIETTTTWDNIVGLVKALVI